MQAAELRTSGSFTEEGFNLNGEKQLNKSGVIVNEEPVLTLLKSSQEIQNENKAIENVTALSEAVAEVKERKGKASTKWDLDLLADDVRKQQEALTKLLTEGEDKSTLLAALKLQQAAAETKIQNSTGAVTDLINRTSPESLKIKAELHNHTNQILADVKRREAQLKYQNDYLAIKIDQMPAVFEAQKTLLAKLVELHVGITEQVQEIQEYRKNSENLTPYLRPTQQIIKDNLIHFGCDLAIFNQDFSKLNSDATNYAKEFETLNTTFAEKKSQFGELRNTHKAVLDQEVSDFINDQRVSENELQSKFTELVNKWNEIKSQHNVYRTEIAMLEAAKDDPNLTFTSRLTIALNEDTQITFSPAKI